MTRSGEISSINEEKITETDLHSSGETIVAQTSLLKSAQEYAGRGMRIIPVNWNKYRWRKDDKP